MSYMFRGMAGEDDDERVTVRVGDGAEQRAHVLNRFAGQNGFSATGELQGEAEGETTGLSVLLFHLPNVRRWLVSPDRLLLETWNEIRGQRTRCGNVGERLVLEADGWEIVIDPFEMKSKEHQALRAVRGHGLTAAGELRRSDGGRFTLQETEPILKTFRFLLAFTFQRWCDPLLLIGRDADGGDLCHKWGVGWVSPYAGHMGWFHDQNPGALKTLFAPLHEALHDDVRGPRVRERHLLVRGDA